MPDFHLTEQMLLAAQHIADARLNQEDISNLIGITRKTLWCWRNLPEFAAEVERAITERRKEIRRLGIADPENRIAALNDRWTRMRRLLEARADDPTMQKAPGGSTGLLVRTIKKVVVEDDSEGSDGKPDGKSEGKSGKKISREVEEFAVDTGLLREMREHEKQAAQELGQWVDKHDTATKLSGTVEVTDSAVDDATKQLTLWREQMKLGLSNSLNPPEMPPTSSTNI